MRMRRTGSPWRQAAFRLAALSSTALCAPALAQTAEPEPVAELSPVVVSARREQPQQTAPQSITTLDRGFIESSGVEDVADIALSVPGVVVSDQNASFGSANIFIRGVGTAVRGVGVSTGVALYRDGVYQPFAHRHPVGLQRSGADRGDARPARRAAGPQRHGRRHPPDLACAVRRLRRGRRRLGRQLRHAPGAASVNLPVVQDRLAVRGAVIAERRESYTRNLRRAEAGLDPDLDADLLAFPGFSARAAERQGDSDRARVSPARRGLREVRGAQRRARRAVHAGDRSVQAPPAHAQRR
jgi:hypothetical protein